MNNQVSEFNNKYKTLENQYNSLTKLTEKLQQNYGLLTRLYVDSIANLADLQKKFESQRGAGQSNENVGR